MSTPGRRALALALAAVACGCGGDDRSPAAVAPSPPAEAMPADTVLTAVSGETGQPIAAARFVVRGRTYESDTAGRVTLADPVPFGSDLAILHAGYLDRETRVRRDGPVQFTLWPRSNACWRSEEFLKQIVYTEAGLVQAIGSTPLRRLPRGETQVTLVLSGELFDNRRAWQEHDYAVGNLNSAIGGRVVYSISTTRPARGIAFDVSFLADDSYCASTGARAYAQVTLSSHEITGGRIVYCDMGAAESSTAAHEIGHTFGLQHTYSGVNLMNAWNYGTAEWNASERLAMRLLLDRPAGNRFPDDDRGVFVASERTETFTCF